MATLISSTSVGATPENSSIKIVRKKKSASKTRIVAPSPEKKANSRSAQMPSFRRAPAAAPVTTRIEPTSVPPAPRLVPAPKSEAKVQSDSNVVPWITLGASAVAASVGAIYVGKTFASVDRLSELEIRTNGNFSGPAGAGTIVIPEEYQDQQRAVFTNGLTATVLLSTGTAGAIASIIALIV